MTFNQAAELVNHKDSQKNSEGMDAFGIVYHKSICKKCDHWDECPVKDRFMTKECNFFQVFNK